MYVYTCMFHRWFQQIYQAHLAASHGTYPWLTLCLSVVRVHVCVCNACIPTPCSQSWYVSFSESVPISCTCACGVRICICDTCTPTSCSQSLYVCMCMIHALPHLAASHCTCACVCDTCTPTSCSQSLYVSFSDSMPITCTCACVCDTCTATLSICMHTCVCTCITYIYM
jgi:hypothetical protein